MTKAKTKRTVVRALAIVLAVLMPLLTTVVAFAEPETGSNIMLFGQKKYESPDINELTGHGEEPEEISVSAGATYKEKAWYEYVMYSDHAVSSYRLNDTSRLLFYDPYTYTNSMVMDVQFDATTTEFDTMSSYSISHTKSQSISTCVTSTTTSSNAVQTSGRDRTGTDVTNGGYTKTTYNHSTVSGTTGTVTSTNDYEYKLKVSASETASLSETITASATAGTEAAEKIVGVVPAETTVKVSASATAGSSTSVGGSVTVNEGWVTDKTTNKTTYSDDYKTTTKYTGYDKVENNTTSSTEGWTELSARITKTLGSSTSNSTTWSETESTTVTKTYAATHFASDGVTPLPWAIVHYSVQMPMKCCLQVKHSGEWVTISTVYCLLTTVQGTCRAWMQNGQVYYEDWGNGEPVVATDFWSQFMTKDQLIQAYSDKLYPEGGAE